MDDVKKLLGAKIRELREKGGLTQANLAERANISNEFLSRIERAEKSPSINTIQNIASSLGVPLKELFNFDNDFMDIESATVGRVLSLLKTADIKSLELIEKIANVVLDQAKKS